MTSEPSQPVGVAEYHRRAMSKVRPSRRASSFTESVIREMTRLANAHGEPVI